MKTFDALKKLIDVIDDQYIVCNLGQTSKELYHLKDRPQNFYMMGSNGLSSSIALGIALANPKLKIWCIDSGASLLMNLGSLSTISFANPLNLTLIVIDNGVYESTENQKTHTNHKTKLDAIARATGFESVFVIENREDIVPTFMELSPGSHFILIKTESENVDIPNISLSSKNIKTRFMETIAKSNK
ncbi:MAG: sulfopyruvate decarboxylase subunit beta [Candidatus Lokiarchaeota archaeon]|nr:sulfopyruvate decarboxylase subunit beta [Candidatus Lokiarchaeota archaeon]